jgi:tetratricopeptide (TPR) repeat protein
VHASVERDFPDERTQCVWARIYRAGDIRAQAKLDDAIAVFASVERDFSREHEDERWGCALARLVRGQTVRARGELDEAFDILASVELDFPDERDYCAWARHERARTLRVRGKPRGRLRGRLEEAQEMRLSVDRDFPDRPGRCARVLAMAGLCDKNEDTSRELLRRASACTDWLRWSAPARYLLGEIDEGELARLMFDWHWRADVEFWRGEMAFRDGRKEDAIRHFRRALDVNIPGYTWPQLEVRLRLKELGV